MLLNKSRTIIELELHRTDRMGLIKFGVALSTNNESFSPFRAGKTLFQTNDDLICLAMIGSHLEFR